MNESNQKQLGKTLWAIADQLRGAMNADDFRDYMLAFLFLRYLSDNYQQAAKKELGRDYPDPDAVGNGGRSSLSVWYEQNPSDVGAFEKQMRLKAHYVIRPEHLWASIAHMARTQDNELLNTLQAGFKYIENESFQSTFSGLFSEINLGSEKLGNASEHFERGKRQNYLSDGHIAKIIDTYQQRPEGIERYARRVGMDEIEANDFNLNISRYVSTAKEEAAIDLSATHKELVEIERQVRESTAKHNEYLRELGLSPLPGHD